MERKTPKDGPDKGVECIDVEWREFPGLLKQLADSCENNDSVIKPPLFRGQANSDWVLQTTLERNARLGNKICVGSYNAAVISMGALLKGFVDDLPSFESDEIEFPPAEELRYRSLQNKELAVFLRHHGFPSPLLDWSRSPYVAAYFAFKEESSNSKKRGIYYFERPRTWAGEAGFEQYDLGPFVAGGRRHANQQAQYTWCSRREGETAFFDTHHQHLEGHLKKIRIPSLSRNEVLADLNAMNINEFSLFGTTDALVQVSLKLLEPQGF
jgi:hypothetical protein